MEIPLLTDIVLIFGLAIVVLFVCHQARIPAIVGFLLTGVIAGPDGLGLIREVHEVDSLAEIGIVLLLFTIGIEFSLKNLIRLKRTILLGGSFQVFFTCLAAFLIAYSLDLGVGKSVFVGFLVSLSSTAIVLKLFQERAEVDSPHGKIVLAVLIFQDIVAVPMMLLTPLMAGTGGDVGGLFLLLLLKGVAILAAALAGGKWVVPRVLFHIARTRSQELFLLTIVVMCFAVAWLTSSAGLSLALGAFLAGLVLSESEYGYEALSKFLPFRDVFTSIFFISVGMLLDIGFFIEKPLFIVALALGVMGLKTIFAGAGAALLGFPFRTMILSGLALGQVGEFSFILSKAGVQNGLLSPEAYQLFLSSSVLTMALAPFAIAAGPGVVRSLLRLPLSQTLRSGLKPVEAEESDGIDPTLKDHILIVGYGINGRNVARAARVAGIPYVIIEMNPVTVKNEKANGEPIFYGDAGQKAVLEHAGIHEARVIVIGIPDLMATRMTTAAARNLNPKIHIIARTPFFNEMETLYALGADEVVPEELEASVEIFARVLTKYLVPRLEIERFIAEVRGDDYKMLRKLSRNATDFSNLKMNLPGVEIVTFRVAEGALVAGKSLGEVELRRQYGVTLLALRRRSEILANPDADTLLLVDDLCVLVAPPDKMAGMKCLFLPCDRPERT